MKKNILRNERGDFSYFTIFIVLAINMILSFMLLLSCVKINCINIRNACKMELNNVSARIYADTFHSQREANLTSYMADLRLTESYQDMLEADFINGLEERIRLEDKDYTISNIELDFHQYDDKIEYVMECDATFNIAMFGEFFPPVTQHIRLTGSHNTKY